MSPLARQIRTQAAMNACQDRHESVPEEWDDEEEVVLKEDDGSDGKYRWDATDGEHTKVCVNYMVTNNTVTVTGLWIQHVTIPTSSFSAEQLADWAEQIDDSLRADLRAELDLQRTEARLDMLEAQEAERGT